MEADYTSLIDDCQQLAACYEDAFYERGVGDLEFLKEALDFLADRYESLLLIREQLECLKGDG